MTRTNPIQTWNGKSHELPVHPSTTVKVWLRNGTTRTRRAVEFGWTNENSPYDIVAYQVITDVS